MRQLVLLLAGPFPSSNLCLNLTEASPIYEPIIVRLGAIWRLAKVVVLWPGNDGWTNRLPNELFRCWPRIAGDGVCGYNCTALCCCQIKGKLVYVRIRPNVKLHDTRNFQFWSPEHRAQQELGKINIDRCSMFEDEDDFTVENTARKFPSLLCYEYLWLKIIY